MNNPTGSGDDGSKTTKPDPEPIVPEPANRPPCGGAAGTRVEAPRPSREPDIESVHRDLTFANSYRQEFIKSLLLIAGALFAFSVSFRPDLRTVSHENLFWIAWIGLGASMVGGFVQLAAWERFYSSYQRYDFHDEPVRGKAYREFITWIRRLALICQLSGFIVGVAALGSFTAVNLANFEKKTTASPGSPVPAAGHG